MEINITIVGQMITFLIFVGFTMKFVWPPLKKTMEERLAKIEEGLASVDRAKKDLDEAKAEACVIVKDAKNQAVEIVDNATFRANKIEEKAKEDAVASADKIRIMALEEIQQQKNKARDELKQELVLLAIAGAEKLIQSNLNKDSNAKILEEFVSKV